MINTYQMCFRKPPPPFPICIIKQIIRHRFGVRMVKALEESVNACRVDFVEIASKMKIDFSIAFFIFFAKYRVVGVQLTHSSLDYREEIVIFYRITITMSKISIFPGSKSLFLDIWFYHRILSVTSYKSQRSCFVSPLLNRGRWREPTFGLIMTWRSYSFVCTSHYLNIIIMQTYRKALYIKARWLIPCVSQI